LKIKFITEPVNAGVSLGLDQHQANWYAGLKIFSCFDYLEESLLNNYKKTLVHKILPTYENLLPSCLKCKWNTWLVQGMQRPWKEKRKDEGMFLGWTHPGLTQLQLGSENYFAISSDIFGVHVFVYVGFIFENTGTLVMKISPDLKKLAGIIIIDSVS